MKSKAAFTKKDLLVVLVCVVFVLMNIAAIGSGGRRRAKRAACLNNLKQLTYAWALFAEDNDNHLVNATNSATDSSHGPGWVTRDYSQDHFYPEDDPPEDQIKNIEDGLLFPYAKKTELYRCPAAPRGHLLTYSIDYCMLGVDVDFGVIPETTDLIIVYTTEIPRPSERSVFHCDYMADWNRCWGIHYEVCSWWNTLPSYHGDGASLSFADGHSEFWPYQDSRSIELGRINDYYLSYTAGPPLSQPGNPDIQRLQMASYGRLGYTTAP